MTAPKSRLYLDGTCHPNKSALQFYVSSVVATDGEFPFAAGDDYRGMTIPGTDAVVLWPKGESPEFPVEIDSPPDDRLPWPLDEFEPPTAETD